LSFMPCERLDGELCAWRLPNWKTSLCHPLLSARSPAGLLHVNRVMPWQLYPGSGPATQGGGYSLQNIYFDGGSQGGESRR